MMMMMIGSVSFSIIQFNYGLGNTAHNTQEKRTQNNTNKQTQTKDKHN